MGGRVLLGKPWFAKANKRVWRGNLGIEDASGPKSRGSRTELSE
jgi:hypothetical protein